jgi:hypothetical protein
MIQGTHPATNDGGTPGVQFQSEETRKIDYYLQEVKSNREEDKLSISMIRRSHDSDHLHSSKFARLLRSPISVGRDPENRLPSSQFSACRRLKTQLVQIERGNEKDFHDPYKKTQKSCFRKLTQR